MCFSAEASFIVGGALIPTSIYCLLKAKPSYLPLALVPLFFGIQQLFEGIVWLGFNSQNQQIINFGSFGFLFFALAFWPVWIPFSAYCISKSKIVASIAILGLLWGLLFYFPLFQNRLHVNIVNHSIQYSFPDLPIFQYLSETSFRFLYILFVIIPVFFCPNKLFWLLALVVLTSAVLSHLLLSYAFVSLWCFFAAVISLFLCYIFHKQ